MCLALMTSLTPKTIKMKKTESNNLKLMIDAESVTIYYDCGEDEDIITICYWHLDEVEEDASVAISMANAINLYHTNQRELLTLIH